jgi:uncharacterized protein YxjI
MPRYLNVADKLLSLRGRMSITDESDSPVYEARGELALFFPTWRISRQGRDVATISRVLLAWRPTWEVECEFGTFRIAKVILSFTDDFEVTGGPYDGAELTGRLIRRDFSIAHRGRTLARATGALLSLRERYTVELVDEGKQAELFTAIAMVTHHIAQRRGGLIDLIGD